MNIKRILAAASASVVAVSAMAVTSITSFAETEKIDLNETISGSGTQQVDGPDGKIEVSGGKADGGPIMFGDYLEDYDLGTVTLEIELEVDSGFANGCIAGSKGEEGKWTPTDWDVSGTSGTVTWSPDSDMSLDSLQMQFWWINPNLVYGEEGSENEGKVLEDNGVGTVTVKSVTITGDKKPVEDDSSSDDSSSDTTSSNNTSTPATEDKTPTSLNDSGSKIETSFKEGVFAAGTKISVKEDKTQSGTDKVAFDISFADKDGKEVQPNGEVSVSIPVPAAFKDAKTLFVFHVEKDGKYTEVKSEVKDGKITFTAKAFSTFVISTKDLNAATTTTDSTPKIKPAGEQTVPALESGPAADRTVPSLQYKDGTTNNGGNGNNSGDNSGNSKPTDPSNPSNPSTGVAIAFAPALLAGAAVVVAKKRK